MSPCGSTSKSLRCAWDAPHGEVWGRYLSGGDMLVFSSQKGGDFGPSPYPKWHRDGAAGLTVVQGVQHCAAGTEV